MPPMPPLSPIDQITERVELLMARHAELQRSNALLAAQVATLSMERDSLQSRLRAAKKRADLPAVSPEQASEPVSAAAPTTAEPAGTPTLPPKEERP